MEPKIIGSLYPLLWVLHPSPRSHPNSQWVIGEVLIRNMEEIQKLLDLAIKSSPNINKTQTL